MLGDSSIQGVVIATPSDSHADLIERAVAAGKAVFCEKPLSQDIGRARSCLENIETANPRLMLGFQRRFDPSFAALKRDLDAGVIGEVNQVLMISRDPTPPPVAYLESSGGMFSDMMIHDFDMARFLLGGEFARISATGANLFSEEAREAGDIDTANCVLTTAEGRQVIIACCRQAPYGYDQRLEALGTKGMLRVDNERETTFSSATKDGFACQPLPHFFMDRYMDAYRLEIEAFCRFAAGEDIAVPGGLDGLRSLELAKAADESLRTGAPVELA